MKSEKESNNRPHIERDNKHWLSLEHWNNDPEFLKLAESEFQSSPLREDMEDENKDGGWARREFLKLMGASLALASASCVRRPVQKIIPYNKAPENMTFGESQHYTSAYFDGSDALGVLIKTREGRPIKIEANPSHPLNEGGLSVRSQASLLSLYDPERIKNPIRNLFNEKRTNKESIHVKWDDLDQKISAQIKKGGAYLLTSSIVSPTLRTAVKDFTQTTKAQHVVWEPLSHEEVREGQKASYGEEVIPQYRFDKAKMIVSIDADFLGTWLTPTAFNKQFSKTRKDIKNMSQLVSFDSTYSLTAANADLRFKIKPSLQLTVVMGLLHEIIIKKGVSSYAGNAAVKSVLSNYENAAQKIGAKPEVFSQIAQQLWAQKGESLVVAGGIVTATDRSRELQVAVNFLNSLLGNEGNTIEGKNGNPALVASYSEIKKLINEMNSGKVKTLIIHRVNPAYALNEDSGFVQALKKVEMVIYTGDRLDETGNYSHYITPDHHALESWGDMELTRDVYTICQPAIMPMYDTRSLISSLAMWSGKQKPTEDFDYDAVRNYWKSNIYSKHGKGQTFEDFWLEALQKGAVGTMNRSSSARSFRVDAFQSIKPSTGASGYELALYPTIHFGDGALANVAWLHELSDAITKISWDNYVLVSLGTADKLKLQEGSMVELTVGPQKLNLPVHIQPGLHDDVLAVPVGYGRTHCGKVGNNIGQNAFLLANTNNEMAQFSGQNVSIKSLNKMYPLACAQGHHTMEGRQIAIEAHLKDYLKKESANIHKPHVWSLWGGHQYSGHRWAMAIDLNLCTGCQACTIACQSENNISVVGKKYVIEGREMHWIRIDRYYTGHPTDPQAVFQPVTCQHCENAPCESVCPVMATTHSDEGLNDMVYNRCVGTRYCSNNCPYKVRRFNWFNYSKDIEKPLHMALNPSVGVRTRGVMEKCTFCVHRIYEAKTKVRNEARSLQDGDIKTACQTSCPTDAIVFGDVNDPKSIVSKKFREEPRSYALLEEWNAGPMVRYQTKIRNDNKETTEAHAPHGATQQGDHS